MIPECIEGGSYKYLGVDQLMVALPRKVKGRVVEEGEGQSRQEVSQEGQEDMDFQSQLAAKNADAHSMVLVGLAVLPGGGTLVAERSSGPRPSNQEVD